MSVFATRGGPCYRCLFRDPPPPGLIPSCADAGVLGVLPGIVGSIQATEAIKLILGQGTTLAGRLLLIDTLHMEFRELRIRRDPECPVCGDQPTVTGLIDYELFCGETAAVAEVADSPEIDVHELKRRVEDGERFQLVDVRKPYEWLVCNLSQQGARLIPLDELPDIISELHFEPANTVFVTVSNDEAAATEAWKILVAESVPNVYILEGGINNWIAMFGDDDLTKTFNRGAGDDQLCYIFDSALGARNPAAEPDAHNLELEYTPKVKLELKRSPTSGGCG